MIHSPWRKMTTAFRIYGVECENVAQFLRRTLETDIKFIVGKFH